MHAVINYGVLIAWYSKHADLLQELKLKVQVLEYWAPGQPVRVQLIPYQGQENLDTHSIIDNLQLSTKVPVPPLTT